MASAEKQRELYWKAKMAGLCVVCGKQPKSQTNQLCDTCNNKPWMSKETRKARQLRYKLEAFAQYGGAKCQCCGESEVDFLSLDHINNDGAQHRRSMWNINSGGNIYVWARARNYPEGLQVLCMNCNFGKRINNGICPHNKG